MQCPAPIAEIILGILRLGLLRIRAKAWEHDAEACVWEADHLHNLPELLSSFSAERLAYYWEVERPCYMDHATAGEWKHFESLWKRLEPHIPNSREEVLAKK